MFHYRVLICLIQIEGEEASRLAKQRLEREKARRYAAADMSEDLSEGEKGENINESSSTHDESTRGRMPRIGSTDAIEAWASQHKDKKLYIVLIRYGANCSALEMILILVYLLSFIFKGVSCFGAWNRYRICPSVNWLVFVYFVICDHGRFSFILFFC